MKVSPQELQALLEKVSPPQWKAHDSYGLVFLANTDEEHRAVFQTLRKWADRDGFPLRLPHHTVSSAGLTKKPRSELDLALGGILGLDEFDEFADHALYNLEKRIMRDRFPVVVVGLATLWESTDPTLQHARVPFMDRLRDRAATLGIPIVTMDDLKEIRAAAPSVDVRAALEKINKQRRAMGRRPLDPVAAGWSDEDILLEASRLKREGLVANPRMINTLKRRLMR